MYCILQLSDEDIHSFISNIYIAPLKETYSEALPAQPRQYRLDQRFPTGGTRTPRGTPAVAKGYARKNKKSEKNILCKNR